MNTGTKTEQLLQKYGDVFREELGTMQNIKAELKVMTGAKPRFHRPRSIPFALKEAVERVLKRLENLGIICKMTHSTWAAPIVPIVKADGSVRVCGDYKVTVNQSLDVDQYPLPKPEDLFATVANGWLVLQIISIKRCSWMKSQRSMQPSTHTWDCTSIHGCPWCGCGSAHAMSQKSMDMILQGLDMLYR